jgi:hypothetical protein
MRDVSIVLSLGTPPPETARLAWSVVHAAGIVGSAGRFESPAPQAPPVPVEVAPVLVVDVLPVLVEPVLVLVGLVAPLDDREPLELVEPGVPVEEVLEPCEVDAPELPDLDAPELPLFPLLPPDVELPELPAESDPPTVGPAPPHPLPDSARPATSSEASQVRRRRMYVLRGGASRAEGGGCPLYAAPREIDLRRACPSRGRSLLRRVAPTRGRCRGCPPRCDDPR